MNSIAQILSCSSLVEGMPNNEYHAHPAFSSSQLKDILRSPAHFHANHLAADREPKIPTENMILGTLVHTLFLEPDKFADEYAVSEKFDRRTKQGKEDAAAFNLINQGKVIVDSDLVEQAKRMATNLRAHPLADEILNNYSINESSIFFEDQETLLKLRIRPDIHVPPCDKWPNGLIIDLKTTDDARPQAFSRTCANFHYDLSAAMYQCGFQQHYNTEDKPPFYFLVIERTRPFNCMHYNAGDLFLSVGFQRYQKSLRSLAECLLLDEWDGYPADLTDINLPSYIVSQYLEL